MSGRAAARRRGWMSAMVLVLPGVALSGVGYRVVVTNEGSGDLTVIDGPTHQVTATWRLGKRPRGIVGSSDGRRLFVALSGSAIGGPGSDPKSLPPADKSADGIGIVDTSTGRLVSMLRGMSDPEQVALSPDGTRLFIASEDTGVAVVVDLGSGRIVRRVPVGGEPEGIGASAAAQLLGVTSEAADSVTLLALADAAPVARIPVGARPRDLGFTPDGHWLFVPGESDASLTVIDVPARAVHKTLHLASAGARPKGIAMASDGARAYVTTGRGGHVDVLDTRGEQFIASVAVGQRPWGIALSPDGRRLFTANGLSNDVSVVDVQTLSVIATVPAGDRPWGVAVVPETQ